MIKTLYLKFGKSLGATKEVIQTTPVTVFVGPNNSGKSKILSEIHEWCNSGRTNQSNVILESIQLDNLSDETIEEKINHVTLKPSLNEAVNLGHILVGKRGTRYQVNRSNMISALKNANSQSSLFCQWYLSYNTLKLDGQSRISLINQQSAGDMQGPAHSSFQYLFRDDERRKEVRRVVHEAFGVHFTIDPTYLGQLRIRLSSRAPKSNQEERGIDQEAVDFHSAATPIEFASDGVKAFTGMITEIIAGDPAVLLIDEPEAFLHPSLAYKLGNEISRASSNSEKRVFVSTHSPNFVMGCIQSGAPVNIVRLTYRSGVPTARILPNEDILKLMRNPLLRSTGVLSGLFYEFVIVTESDADRAFYQEINERLLRYKPELGIPNCLFINAQNKQTVQTIIRPLRELGIAAVGIVDVDILKEGGAVWSSFLESAFIPEIERQSLSITRVAVKQKFDAIGKEMKRHGGVELLNPADKEAANNLFNRLEEYGLYVVRKGELESWLPQLNAGGHGPSWLINIFEKMGEDPNDPNYMRPSDSDVWIFIGGIKSWLINPLRKGIPT